MVGVVMPPETFLDLHTVYGDGGDYFNLDRYNIFDRFPYILIIIGLN